MSRLLAAMLLFPAVGLAQEKKGANFAFLVSCGEKYNKAQLHPLAKSFRDMDDYRKALLATGFDADNIVFMHDETPKPQRFLPEKAKILKELKLLLSAVGPQDTLVVALNGHGLHFKGDKTSYFCPLDAKVSDKTTMIPMDGDGGLFPILKGCKAKRKLLVVGACRNDPAKTSQAAEQIDLDLFDPDEVPEGIVALYSCRAGQKTYFEEKQDRSYFFDHLIRAWQGEYHPDEEAMTLESIFDKVKDKTSAAVRNEYGEAQVPEVRREYQGEWLVTRAKTAPKPMPAVPKGPKPGEVREVGISAKFKMTFCWVPAGEEQLGSPDEELDFATRTNFVGKRPAAFDAQTEAARGKFKTAGFWMGKYEVTQEEYQSVMADNPSRFKGDRLPVERVQWEDCQKFIEKCGVKGMKLPHEDQWEYACRGGKGNKRAFYWGDELNGDKANNNGNYPYGVSAKGPAKEKTTAVGSYEAAAPHPWGLCDMHGNVWEWCENLYEPTGTYYVARGGGWLYKGACCRAGDRHTLKMDLTLGNGSAGFRVILVP